MFLQQLYLNNFEIFLPEILLSFFILVLLSFGTYYRKKYCMYFLQTCNHLIFFVLLLLFFLEWNITLSQTLANGLFYSDPFIRDLKLFMILTLLNCFWIQEKYIQNQKIVFFENSILLLISLLGLMFFISSNHFLSFYLSIELQSLSFYILALSKRNSFFGVEASLKYFVLGAIGSGFLLYGISYIYGSMGTLNFSQLFEITYHFYFDLNTHYFMTFFYGLFFFFCGLFFKVGAVPFHMWIPDVYEGAANHISLFFATGPKIALIGFLIHFFFHVVPSVSLFLETLFYPVAFFSILLGSLSSLTQWKIKRFLAYSSITHLGFLFLGFIHFSPENCLGVLFYLLVYVLMSMNIWNIYLSIFIEKKPITFLTDFTSFFQLNKWLSFLLLINFFSMSGIPPLIGFFSKFFLLFGVLKQHSFSIVFMSLLISVLSTFYYLRIIKILFFDKKKRFLPLNSITKRQSFFILFTAQPMSFFFLFPNGFFKMLENIYLHMI